MIFALATFVVLLVMARGELDLKEIIGVIALLILTGGVIAVLHLEPIFLMAVVAIVDIYLFLRIFGGDIAIR